MRPSLPTAALLAACAVYAVAQEEPLRAGSPGVPVPKRIKMVVPEYPPTAQALGLRGIVILELTIDPTGKVSNARVVRSVPPFDENAVAAAAQWVYEPVKVDGKAVSVLLTVPITFALPLPQIERATGVPELRQGSSPAVPASAPDQAATVVATVALDDEGFVVDAQVKSGEAPWDEAFLFALRTWRFAVPPDAPPIAFEVTAVFPPKSSKELVKLKITDPHPAPEREEPAAPPSPSPSADASASPVPEATPPAPSPAPSAVPSPEPVPAPSPAPPTRTDVPTEVLTPSHPPAVAPTPAPPMVPAVPVSSVVGVELGEGVPDLASGRRPVVPPVARIEGLTGEVRVRFSVDGSGGTSLQQVEGPEKLQEAARAVVGSWTFRRTSLERLYLMATLTYEADGARAKVTTAQP